MSKVFSRDLVLDPFCGCSTTIDAAEKLGRDWIGIGVTQLAISLIKKRLQDTNESLASDRSTLST